MINKATSAWSSHVAFASANEDGNGNHAVTAAASFLQKKNMTAAAFGVALAKATSPDLHRGAPGRWEFVTVLDSGSRI